jgi:hypothetical protein
MNKKNDFITKLDKLYALGCEIQMDYYENDIEDEFIDELETLMMHCEVALKIFNK